ncbi:major facilitator superfamily domain-containing protein [Lipomyces arxii]|uniref:major facilitator superfamily domain-containing protein n=1 Tax=Lipomyces arxii TaxID=56418 RepID=UPI0034CFA85B
MTSDEETVSLNISDALGIDGNYVSKEKFNNSLDDSQAVQESVIDTRASNGPIPDGGLQAWLQVSGSFFLFMNSWGISNSFGVYQNYYVQNALSNKSESDIAWIGSIQSSLLLFVGVITGPYFDQGCFRHLVMIGSFTVVLGMMMTSLGSQYWHVMLSQAVLSGIGSGLLFIPSVAILPQYFTTKRSFATGISASGSSIGGVIYPIMFHKLQPRIGFGWATRAIAFMMLGTQLYAFSVMKCRALPSTKRSLIDKTVFSEPAFLSFSVASFFGFVGIYIPFYYIQPFAVSKGIFSESTAFWLLPILNAASTFGRVIPNRLADKIGPLNVLVPFTVITMVIGFCWLSATTAVRIILIALFYGFFSGTFVSLPPSVAASLSPDLSLIGTRLGMLFFFCAFGLLIGTPVAGALVRTHAGYTAAVVFCGASVLASGFFILSTRLLKVGMTLKVKA